MDKKAEIMLARFRQSLESEQFDELTIYTFLIFMRSYLHRSEYPAIIDFCDLIAHTPYNHDRLEEIVELITDTLCSRKKQIRIGGENYPAEVVKSRFKKLDMYHIEYVFASLDKKHTEVRNIRQYLMTTLYNAPVTMNHYYDAEVRSSGIL